MSNPFAWQAGVNLKRSVEATGRTPTVNVWAVTLWLAAKEAGMSVEDVINVLKLTSTYEVPPVDKAAALRDLGF